MKKFGYLALILAVVFFASVAANAQPNTPAPSKKAAVQKSYTKLTEDSFVNLSAELRAASLNLRNSNKPIDPKSRMAEIDKIFEKYNASRQDYRNYSLSLRKDPKRLIKVNQRIDAKTKTLTN